MSNFLKNCNDPFWDPDGGIYPDESVRSLNTLLTRSVLGSIAKPACLNNSPVDCVESNYRMLLELQGRSLTKS